MSHLFSPLTIRNTVFKNRISISPMCQYSAIDGLANDWHLVHLGSRAVGGAALIMQEATAVVPEGRISYGDLGIWNDEQMEKLQQIVAFIHSQGAKAGIQLAHAGRKASCEVAWKGGQQLPAGGENGWQTYSASPFAFKPDQEPPVELSLEEIEQTIKSFAVAAKRAQDIGYDVVEIHAAHGYLLHQFYSPLSNGRSDKYGGSFDNRIRFLVETVENIREVLDAHRPLFVRISATDWTEGGWNINDSVALAKVLKEKGADLVDTSTGGNVPNAVIPSAPGYQVPFATEIKKEAGIMTCAVGQINNPGLAEDIIKHNKADMIMIGRESLRDPYFPLHSAHALEVNVDWPVQYQRAKPY